MFKINFRCGVLFSIDCCSNAIISRQAALYSKLLTTYQNPFPTIELNHHNLYLVKSAFKVQCPILPFVPNYPGVPYAVFIIGGGTRGWNAVFKGGGGKFLEVKNSASAPAIALARRRGVSGGVPPQKLELFFEYVQA